MPTQAIHFFFSPPPDSCRTAGLQYTDKASIRFLSVPSPRLLNQCFGPITLHLFKPSVLTNIEKLLLLQRSPLTTD